MTSLRKAIGYMAEIMAKMIEANIRVNSAIMDVMKKKMKMSEKDNNLGFYI
jgi:protoporphyrinogen oxidase